MPRNVEIKARVADPEALRRAVAARATEGPLEIAQDDTFFRCDQGRLKLRCFSPASGELIFYRRADQQGPKESFYERSSTSDPETLRRVLALACGLAGRVIKQRTLYLIGRTRVHLDRVQGLGDFVELEVVLEDHEPATAGEREARSLMTELGVNPADLIEVAYVDLMAESARHSPR